MASRRAAQAGRGEASRRGRSTGGSPDGLSSGTPAEPAQPADPQALARAVVLRQLTIAPRTRAQLAAALARRGVPDEAAEAVLDRFEEVDLVDDEQFARMWVASRHTGRGLARRALAHELRQRGVADETVREAVDAIRPDDELAAARELVRRRLPAMRADDPARRIRRLAGMLARKGYGAGVVFTAIRLESADLELEDPGAAGDGAGDLEL